MRIHELLEECIEYIVVEGVLGADPRLLRDHVRTIEPKVDEAYFGHLWTLLARSSTIEIVIAADVLPGVEKDVPDVPPPAGADLFRVLAHDDGGSPPINTSDLAGLLERYPGRIRIRCTEDEIFFRLTGSRTKIHRITPMIFTYLQLAARSREKGISAVELGPMTESNQKSVFHYMRVLCQLGLCAKIPAALHGSNTNVLVFRKFLDKNPNYQAHKPPLKDEPEEPQPEAPHAVATEAGDSATEVQGLGFNFTPFSEIELVAGHVPKSRLLKVLDHPSLKNHLLGNHHLLQVIGWPDDEHFLTRHRRQLQRHIRAWVREGIVEYVDIGTAKRACLRLTKYNPDYVPPASGPATLSEIEEIKEVAYSPDDFAEPFQYQGGALATRSIEAQVVEAIHESGSVGQTLAGLSRALSGLYNRTLDHIVNRQDLVFLPDHLRHRAIRITLENENGERHLRVFSLDEYCKHVLRVNMPGAKPCSWARGGYFADLSFRDVASNPQDYYAVSLRLAGTIVPVGKSTPGRPKGKKDSHPRAIPAIQPKAKKGADETEDENKQFKYSNDIQERGRPRKYIYVVNEDGKRNRTLLGDLPVKPDLPQVLIYVKDEGILVPAPPGYTGVGAVPKLTEQQIADGKPAEFFLGSSAPASSRKGGAKKGKKPAKAKAKAKAKPKPQSKRALSDDEGEVVEGEGVEDDKKPAAGPSKRARRTTQAEVSYAEELELDEGEPPGSLQEAPSNSGEQPTAEASVVLSTDAPDVVTPIAPSTEVSKAAEATPSASRPKRTRKKPDVLLPSDPTSEDQPPQKKTRRGLAKQIEVTNAQPVPVSPVKTAPQEGTAPSANHVNDDTVLQFFTDAAAVMAARDSQAPVQAIPSGVVAAGSGLQPEEPIPGSLAAAPVSNEASAAAAASGSAIQTPAPVANGQAQSLTPIKDAKAPQKRPLHKPIVRLDVGVFQRMQEVLQCLTDLGGVFTETKLWQEHRDWAQRHAGTDHPNAPLRGTGSGMDRKVFKRTLNKLLEDGKIKERSATIPTTTGRWIKVVVVFLAESTDDDINAYIRHLANSATAAVASPARTKAALEYSAYKRPAPRASVAKTEPEESQVQPAGVRGALTPREVYLSEPGMFAFLLGYITGRAIRAKTLHCAAVKAMETNPTADSVVSLSPKIFALPFLFDEILLKDYLEIYQVMTYDEEVYAFCKVPSNLQLKLCDLPKNISDKINLTGRYAQSPKNNIRALLSILSFLQTVTPLTATADEAAATVHIKGEPKTHPMHFEPNEDPDSPSTYYLVHDIVPVYNIADESMSLLGFMDASKHEYLDGLWSAIRSAALHFHAALPRITLPPWPYTPHYSGVLSGARDYQRVLRSARRWRQDIPLLAGQRIALEAANSPTKMPITAPSDIAKLAYDLALPVSFVENYLKRRNQVAEPRTYRRRVVRIAMKPPAEERGVWENLNRHRLTVKQKEKMAVGNELAERIRASREVYDNRVNAAAQAAGIPVTPELKDYIARNRPMKRLGVIVTPEEMSAIVDSFIRVQSGDTRPHTFRATRFQPKGGRVVKKVLPQGKPTGSCSTCLGFNRDDDITAARRHRHNWNKEEDELLFDADTVIRARSHGQVHRGRPALQQIFPLISEQVLRSRLKKMHELPGQAAYQKRLEEAFHEIISTNRGTAELPDTNPSSQVDFPLRQYLDYLRPRVNKALLKLPVSAEPVMAGRAPAPDLMADVPSLVDMFEWSYLMPEADAYTQLLEQPNLGEDARLNVVSGHSVIVKDTVSAPAWAGHRAGVTRAILKMIVATPQEVYDMQAATKLLSMPKEEYERQIAALVNEGILNRNSQHRTPGRMYSFAQPWLQASESHLPSQFNMEVQETSEKLDEGSIAWPVVGKHGDLAALMTMVSNNEVDIAFAAEDMTMNDFDRLSYNTRSLTDADFECDMYVTRHQKHTPRPSATAPPHPRAFPKLQPWPPAPPAELEDINTVLAAVQNAGGPGIDRPTLQAQTELSADALDAVFASFTQGEPKIFWAGYDTARIISKDFWHEWTVAVPNSSIERLSPRRWVDIWGNIIPEDWDRAVRSVTGQVMHRPGITEWDLRERMSTTLDRMEVTDVLGYLVETGVLERKRVNGTLPPVQATGEEGRSVTYSATARMWI